MYCPYRYETPVQPVAQSGTVQSIAVQQFNRLTTDDAGLYICKAESSAGVIEKRVQLVVDSLPTRGDITGLLYFSYQSSGVRPIFQCVVFL